jgi:phage gp46-like protein
MALTSQGSDIAVTVSPTSGKLRRVWDTTGPNAGNPRFDNTQAHAVWCSVFCLRNAYWGDTAGTFGSLVATLRQDPKATPAKFVGYAEDGLAPLVQQSRISNVQVFATRDFDRMDCEVDYQTPDAGQQTVRASLPIT